MTNITLAVNNTPANTFKWRDRFGVFHPVDKMSTQHVFFTLRLVWNHTMPKSATLQEGQRYSSFDAHYTADYMKQAIKALAKELAKRKDMQPDWQRQLDKMLAWLATGQLAWLATGQPATPTTTASLKAGDLPSQRGIVPPAGAGRRTRCTSSTWPTAPATRSTSPT